VVGGKILAMDSIKKFATAKGLFNARDAAMGKQTFLQNVGGNIASKIGKLPGAQGIKNFFGKFKF